MLFAPKDRQCYNLEIQKWSRDFGAQWFSMHDTSLIPSPLLSPYWPGNEASITSISYGSNTQNKNQYVGLWYSLL